MARKHPIGRLADSAIKSLKDPVGTAGKVVEQAKGTAAFGKTVAEQVGKSAVAKATETAGVVAARAGRRKTPGKPPNVPTDAPRAESSAPLRPVPDVNEAGHTPQENNPPGPAASPADVAAVVEAAVAEDPKKTAATPAKKAPAKKAAAKKTAKKAAATTSSPGDRLPRKSAARKSAPAETPPADAPRAASQRDSRVTPTPRPSPPAQVDLTPTGHDDPLE